MPIAKRLAKAVTASVLTILLLFILIENLNYLIIYCSSDNISFNPLFLARILGDGRMGDDEYSDYYDYNNYTTN